MCKRLVPRDPCARRVSSQPHFDARNPFLHDVFVCTIGSRHRLETPNILWFCLCADGVECYTFDMETRHASVSFFAARHGQMRAQRNGFFRVGKDSKSGLKRIVEAHDPKSDSTDLNESRAALNRTIAHCAKMRDARETRQVFIEAITQ